MIIRRVLHRIDDRLTQLELIVVRCIRTAAEACIDGFAAAGFALHGSPPEQYRDRETSLEREEESSSKREQTEPRQRKKNARKGSQLG
jgi:hypothetical protein